MAEYIEREALLKKAIEEKRFVFQMEDLLNSEVVFKTVYKDLADFILGVPAADVVPVVHGRWIATQEPLGWRDVDCVECSACHDSWVVNEDYGTGDFVDFWKYCPACGAKMDLE